MLPYTSMDMVRAMQREWFEDDRKSANPDATDAPPSGRGYAPDPLGLALAKLRPWQALRGVGGRMPRRRRCGSRCAA